MEWPDRFSGRDLALKEGFKPGDNVILTLARGRPKVAAPQSAKDYWEDLVGIAHASPPSVESLDKAQPAPLNPREASEGTPPAKNGLGVVPEKSLSREEEIARLNRLKVRATCILAASIRLPRGTDETKVKELAHELFKWVVEQ